MADDIVERLRVAAVGLPQDDWWMNQTAANEIERLRAAGDALAEALTLPFALSSTAARDAWAAWQEARREQ